MKYCHHCAEKLTLRVPGGDDRARYCCAGCGAVFYQNPKNVVGTLPVFGDRVLLCRRAIEPRLGKWTLPAGFMENDETTLEGAVRETWEEARARVRAEEDCLYTLFNLPDINQVYMFFRAELLQQEDGPDFSESMESSEVALFSEAEIPWRELAFPVVYCTLQHYFKDRAEGRFPVRMIDIHRVFSTDNGSTDTAGTDVIDTIPDRPFTATLISRSQDG